jgi:hypothetical protein
MYERYEIIPGESIGPFRLGMSREEIQELGIHPMRPLADGEGTYFSLVDADLDPARGSPKPGVYVHYDDGGRCYKISAVFAYDPSPPVFTLFGQVVNGMTDTEAAALIGRVGADVRFSYATVKSRSAGISATKWERTDDHIMSMTVVPRVHLDVYGFCAADIHQLADALARVLDTSLHHKRLAGGRTWYTTQHVEAILRSIREGKRAYGPRPILELVRNDPKTGSRDPLYLGGGDHLLRVRASARDLDRIEQALIESELEYTLLKRARRRAGERL